MAFGLEVPPNSILTAESDVDAVLQSSWSKLVASTIDWSAIFVSAVKGRRDVILECGDVGATRDSGERAATALT